MKYFFAKTAAMTPTEEVVGGTGLAAAGAYMARNTGKGSAPASGSRADRLRGMRDTVRDDLNTQRGRFREITRPGVYVKGDDVIRQGKAVARKERQLDRINRLRKGIGGSGFAGRGLAGKILAGAGLALLGKGVLYGD